jgi:CheY-like chemotaxis protein
VLAGADILVVEDDDDLRDLLVETIVAAGYTVGEARDGRDALAYLRHHDLPQLILLDLVMPEMDGVAFIVQQRREPRLASTPIVLMSASNEDTSEVEAAGRLRKPFDMAALFALLQSLVKRG